MKKTTSTILISLFIIAGRVQAQDRGERHQDPHPKNIILMIGDGMGVAQIYAGLTANRGRLNLEEFKYIGFSKTNSANRYITESAAGATAFAIGEKTHNGAIGVDANDRPRPTILEIAEKHGLSTGIVALTYLTDATPAAFTAHVPSRDVPEEAAADYLESGVDVFIGAGKEYFTDREDGRDLTAELKRMDYQVLYDIDKIISVKKGKVAGFLPERRLAERGDQLARTSLTAIRILNRNPKGFFLMIEGSKIDNGGHENDLDYVVEEMLDFDRTIGQVLEFAKKDGETLVVVTADHETGGLTITGGNLKTGEVEGEFSTGGHTAVMVPVFAFGPGAEAFSGIYHNNTIFDKFMKAFPFTN